MSDRIFKVNANADDLVHKYVFVGKLPTEVSSILQNLQSRGDLDVLSTEDAEILRHYFGNDWEFRLGIYAFHESNIQHGLEDSLQGTRYKSYASFKQAIREDQVERDAIVKGRAEYASEISKEYKRFLADRLHYIEDFEIRYDDNIKMVRQKIYLVCSHLRYFIRPEWQHLFSANDKNLSTETLNLSGTPQLNLSIDPIAELESLSARNGFANAVNAMLSQKSRVTDVQDSFLHDYCPIEKEEIFMVTVQQVVNTLSKTVTEQLPEVKKLFLSRYFPHIKKWVDYLNDRVDFVSEGKRDRQIIKDYVTSENEVVTLAESITARNPLQSAITSLSFEVELNSSQSSAVRIDLEKLFDHIEVDYNLMLITWRGNTRDTPARHKLKKDMQMFERDIAGLRQWLHPTDESGKINTLTMRFKAIDELEANLTITLLSSGAYKMILKWETNRAATITNVSRCIQYIKDFIEHKILPIPHLLDRHDTFQLPLPCSPFIESCDSLTKNVIIKSMQQKVFFSGTKDFSYQNFKTLAHCFKSFITVSSETGEISSYWARFPRANTIIAKLVEKNLYDLPALSELTPKEWQSLKLFSDTKANTQYVEEFRNKVNSLTAKKIVFFFTRHSKNNNPNIYKKIINDFINPRNLKLSDLSKDQIQLQALIKELSQRLGMSKKDAFEVYREYLNSDGIDLISPKVSTGPKCEIKKKNGQFRLTITNLRDYTRKSSISFLSKLITSFFGKFVNLYEDDEIEAFLKSNKRLCSGDFVQDIGLETALDSTSPDEDDDDFIDFDFDVPSNSEINESLDLHHELDVGREAPVPSARLDASIKAMTNVDQGKSRLDLLKSRDKDIFVAKQKPGFASRCKVKRQPVVLTEDEYAIQDKTTFKNPAALPEGFKYRDYYYICPEFWCPRLGKAVHAKDLHDITWNYTYDNGIAVPSVASAKCADGEFAEVATDGISGWKAKGLGGRYEYPGFLTDHFSDEKKGVPCCFGTDQSVTNDTSSFFRLLNNNSKPEDKSTKVSSQRYRLGPNKTPIEKGRFGKLIPNLDVFFNGNVDPLQKIYDEKFDRFLRLGITHDDNSFLSALMAIVNHSLLDLNFKDTAAFRAYIASHITDDLLFRSLKNGNLKIIFEDYPGDDYLAKFRHYIEFEEKLESEYLWDLFCRPIPWLFPEGVNLFVLSYNAKEDDATLKCPLGEVITNFYHAGKQAAFIATDGKYYEPIVQVNNSLALQATFSPEISYARLEKHFHECKGRPRGTMIPFFVLERLIQKGSDQLQPKFQIVNAYNKVRYIITKDSTIIPVEQGYGPVQQFNIPLGSIKEMPQMTYKHFERNLSEFVAIFYPDCVPQKILLDEDGQPAALRLENDFVVPVKFSSSNIPYPIDEQWLFRELDDDIFDRPYFVDERVKLVSEFYFLRESLERYRHELASYLQADMDRSDGDRIAKKYLLRIKSVLDAKDRLGNDLPVWAKRSLLEDIFFKPASNNLVNEIIDTRKDSKDLDYTLPISRKLCLSNKSNKITCNGNPHCTWRRRCKMYLPRKYVATFTMLIVDELLRDTVGREMIFENRLETIVRTNRVEVKAKHILFDDTVTSFVLNIMEKFDLRKEKEKSLIDYLEPSSVASRNHLQNLKKNILFRGFMRFPQQPFGLQAKLIPISSRRGNTLYYTAVSNSLYNTASYVISDIMNKPQFNSDQLRQDIVRSLKAEKDWQSYLVRLSNLGESATLHIQSFSHLAKLIEETDWGGSIVDIDVISRIYPVDFRLIDSASQESSHDNNNGPVVKLFAITPFDIRLVYQKMKSNVSFRDV